MVDTRCWTIGSTDLPREKVAASLTLEPLLSSEPTISGYSGFTIIIIYSW